MTDCSSFTKDSFLFFCFCCFCSIILFSPPNYSWQFRASCFPRAAFSLLYLSDSAEIGGKSRSTKKIKQQGFSRVCSHGCHLVILQEADVLRCYQWRGRVALPLSHVAVQGSWQGRTCSYSSWLPPWWLKQANRCSWRLILQK